MTRRFQVHRHSVVRADAESMFVACRDVPGAETGDLVELSSAEGSDTRVGVVVERTSHAGDDFVRIELRQPDPRS